MMMETIHLTMNYDKQKKTKNGKPMLCSCVSCIINLRYRKENDGIGHLRKGLVVIYFLQTNLPTVPQHQFVFLDIRVVVNIPYHKHHPIDEQSNIVVVMELFSSSTRIKRNTFICTQENNRVVIMQFTKRHNPGNNLISISFFFLIPLLFHLCFFC